MSIERIISGLGIALVAMVSVPTTTDDTTHNIRSQPAVKIADWGDIVPVTPTETILVKVSAGILVSPES